MLVELRDGEDIAERFRDNSDTVHVVVEKFIPVHAVQGVHLSSDGRDWRKNTRDGLHSSECLSMKNIVGFLTSHNSGVTMCT